MAALLTSLGIEASDYLRIPSWAFGVLTGVTVAWFRWRWKPRK